MSRRPNKLWVVFCREYTERIRARWFRISTVLGPIVFALIMLLPPWLAKGAKASNAISQIIILDATGTDLGQRIAYALNSGPLDTSLTVVRAVTPMALPAAESIATRSIVRHESQGYLVVDGGTLAGVSARYAGANAAVVGDVDRLRRVVGQQSVLARLEHLGLRREDAMAITRAQLKLSTERITESGRETSGAVSIYFAFGVATLLYLSIFMYGQNVLHGVLEEKQSRVAEVVIASLSTEELLTGKVLGVGAVGLTQMLIWGLAALGIFALRDPLLTRIGAPHPPLGLPAIPPGMAALLIAFFVLGYTFYAALFATAGSLVSSEMDAQQIQIPIGLLLATTMVSVAPILSSPDGGIAHVLSILPFSAPIVMPLRLSLISIKPLEVGVSLFSLVAGCYIAVFLAARIYRVGLLMYGKQPSPGELWRIVRDAK